METVNLKEKYNKIIATGLLLPKNKVSRNGVLYDWDSAKNTVDKIIGLPASYNHKIEDLSKPVGHYTDAIALESRPTSGKWKDIWDKTTEELGHEQPGIYYEMDINPNSEYADSITRRDVRKVSIQVIPEDQVKESDDAGNSYTRAYIKDWVEAAVVPSPGFMETTMQVLAESFNIQKIKKESFKKISNVVGKKFGGYIHPDDSRVKHLDIGLGDTVFDGNKWYAIEENIEDDNMKEDHMKVGDEIDVNGKKMKIIEITDDGYKIGYSEQQSTTTNPGATTVMVRKKEEEDKMKEAYEDFYAKDEYEAKKKDEEIAKKQNKKVKFVRIHPKNLYSDKSDDLWQAKIVKENIEVNKMEKCETCRSDVKEETQEEENKMEEFVSKEQYENDMHKVVTILEKFKEELEDKEVEVEENVQEETEEENVDEEKKEDASTPQDEEARADIEQPIKKEDASTPQDEDAVNKNMEKEDEETKTEDASTPQDEDAVNKNMENVEDEETKTEDASTPQDEDAVNKNMENVEDEETKTESEDEEKKESDDEETKSEAEVEGEDDEEEGEPVPPIEEKLDLNDVTSNKKEGLHKHLKGLF